MKFALFTGMTGTTWDDVLARWRYGDQAGWDAACVTDHLMPNTADRVGDTLECWTALAALAAQTTRMRGGTIVSGNTYRHPALLAKMAANVDIISRGRLERLADAPLMPKPVQQPHPELMIGGGGEKVTLRIAAAHADHWNVWGGPATLAHKGRILDEHCARVGRAEQAYMKRMGADAGKARDTVLAGSASEIKDKLAKLQAAGVGMLFIPTFLLPTNRCPTLDRFMSEIAPAFRSPRARDGAGDILPGTVSSARNRSATSPISWLH